MSIFAKIKQFLGIGTVKVTLQIPGTMNTDEGKIEGTIHLEAKSDQIIESLEVELKETFTTGRGDDKTEKKFSIGTVKLPGFEMKEGDVKDVPFTLTYTYAKTSNESMAEKGGVMGGLGKMASFASNEKSTFEMIATCDVKGASLDPNDIKEIKRVK